MIWGIEFLQEAEKDMKRLDHSVQIQVLKGIKKVSKNPLPVSQGSYGKPLGNKENTKYLPENVSYELANFEEFMKKRQELMSKKLKKILL